MFDECHTVRSGCHWQEAATRATTSPLATTSKGAAEAAAAAATTTTTATTKPWILVTATAAATAAAIIHCCYLCRTSITTATASTAATTTHSSTHHFTGITVNLSWDFRWLRCVFSSFLQVMYREAIGGRSGSAHIFLPGPYPVSAIWKMCLLVSLLPQGLLRRVQPCLIRQKTVLRV